MGRMHIRPIQWQLARTVTPDDSPYKKIKVPHALHCHLRWWGCSHAMHNGTFLHDPQPQAIVFTDASDTGWGAHCMGEEIQGSWLPSETHLHINILEMKAVLIAIRHFAPTLKGKVVLFLCDNSTTVWHLKKMGGVEVWQLNVLAWLIFSKAAKWGILLQARHIPGALNVIADRLSRKGQIQETEWSLSPTVFNLHL